MLLNQGVGFRWRTVRWQRGACLSRTERSCLLKSVMGVSGVMDWARSCLKEFLSILLIEQNCVVTGWTAGLECQADIERQCGRMWSRQVERRRHPLCLWKTRSKRWPCLCVGSVTDWLRLNISYMSCIFLKMWSFRVSKWMLKSSIISTLPDIVSQYSRNSGNWSKNMVSVNAFFLFGGGR